MIFNIEEQGTKEHLNRATKEMPSAKPLIEALVAHADPFLVQDGPGGIEFSAKKPVNNRPNRARVKLFTVAEGPMQGRVAAFFYKPSQIPFSRDRHSYGVCMIPSTGPGQSDIGDWIFFASSGLDPAARPSGLRQAFAFTVPD
jgi:hypothetical protein